MATRTENLVGKLSVHDAEWKAGLARAATQFRAFSSGIARAGLAGFSGITSGLRGTFNQAVSLAAGAAGRIKSILGAVGIAGAIGGAVAGGLSLGGAFKEAADYETAIVQFQTILGSAEAARERIADLTQFAAATPFEMPETLSASRQLQIFTKGALATGKGLTQIGDIAASVGQPFSDVAFWVGRMYDALASGRPAGEAFMRLQEMGVISGDVRGQLEALSESGAGIGVVWDRFTKSTSQFSGGMGRLSQTFSGMMSTLGDSFAGVQRSFGGPVIAALKPVIQWATDNLDMIAGRAANVGGQVAQFITKAFSAFKGGNLTEFIFGKDFSERASSALKWAETLWTTLRDGEGLGFLFDSLQTGLAAAGNTLIGSLQTGVNMLGQTLAVLFQGETLAGIAQSFVGVAQVFGSALLESLSDPITFIQAGIEYAFIQAGSLLLQALQKAAPILDALTYPFRRMVEWAGGGVMAKPSEAIAQNLPIFQGLAQESFGDTLARRRSEGLNFAGYSTAEMRDAGMANLGSGGAALAEAGRQLAAGVIAASKDFKPADFFDASAQSARVQSRLDAAPSSAPRREDVFGPAKIDAFAEKVGRVISMGSPRDEIIRQSQILERMERSFAEMVPST